MVNSFSICLYRKVVGDVSGGIIIDDPDKITAGWSLTYIKHFCRLIITVASYKGEIAAVAA
jgi:hypothetical protein